MPNILSGYQMPLIRNNTGPLKCFSFGFQITLENFNNKLESDSNK